MSLSQPEQLTFELPCMTLKAQQWGDPEGIPVLGLHGWLDNSASYFRLAPLLKGLNFVSLDMAGHGLSDHRRGAGPYNIWEDVSEIIGVADQLGWDSFSMIGHSRGAMLSMLTAGTFPKRVEKVVLLDGLWPKPSTPAEAPELLALSIQQCQRQRSSRTFSSLDEMVDTRFNGRWPLSREAARALALRGHRKVEGGYQWSSDGRLINGSAIKLTQEHLDAFMQRITMPVKLLLADGGISKSYGIASADVAGIDNIDIEETAGTHHWHMEEQADELAVIINHFFND